MSVRRRGEMGQAALASAAALAKVSAVALGTLAVVSRWILVTVGLPSLGSKVRLALVSIDSGVRPALPSSAESAIEKHEAGAAATSSSGLVPGPSSNPPR